MADSCRVGPDYPGFVERAGRRYSVTVSTDRDGLIDYFNLIDILTEEFAFEADYQIDSLTEEKIWEIVDDFGGLEDLPEPEVATNSPKTTVLAEDGDRAFFEKILDERYPFYSDLGSEFRDEAIDTLMRNQNESQAFQDVILDELADGFEDLKYGG